MNKRYKKNRMSALEQIINKQQVEIENLNQHLTMDKDLWQQMLEHKDFVIDMQSKDNNQYVLMCKFLVDILLLTSTLDSILYDDNAVSQAVKTAIAIFKMELSKAMRMIQYDGGKGYNIDPFINEDNDIDLSDEYGERTF